MRNKKLFIMDDVKNKHSHKSTVYHVEFFKPINGQKDYFFGSLAAIYELFTPEEIGCKVNNLWNKGVSKKPYTSKTCTISLQPFYRKQSIKTKL